MTKYIHPDETLNIYYRVSEDTNELEDIVHIEKDGEEENISDLPDLQNTKIIQWSPDSEHEDEEFEFDIDRFGTQKVKVAKIPKNKVWNWNDGENGDDNDYWVFNNENKDNYVTNPTVSGSHSLQNIGSDGDGWLYLKENIFSHVYNFNNFENEYYIMDSGTDVSTSNPHQIQFLKNTDPIESVITIFFRNGGDVRLSVDGAGRTTKSIGYPNNEWLRTYFYYDSENNKFVVDVYSEDNSKWINHEGTVTQDATDKNFELDNIKSVQIFGNDGSGWSTGDYHIDHLRISIDEPSNEPII